MPTALIVVDMQNGFLREGNLASGDCAAVLPAVVDEVEQALNAGHYVFFTAETHEPDDAEFQIFPEHCVRGTSEAELVDELAKYLDREKVYLVPKRRYSAMFETQLEGLLHRFSIDNVRICGVCTDICVLYTSADLRNRDIPVTVAGGATATFDATGHAAGETRDRTLAHMGTILGVQVEERA